ncbi:MAG: MBL fold metallo-hydrolase [Gammaproteobacteria bacterium]|nr:MBL fold metallo-hydrolase [Gammaproteobacteria bacterium]
MIKTLTITQLVENTAVGSGLLGEHGNAFLIEADDYCLLFDTGQGLTLKHNAKQLNAPIKSIESIILSHGHYDHIGGLTEALDMTGPINLYLHPEALGTKFNQNGRSIGAPTNDIAKIRSLTRQIIYTQKPTEITTGIHVTGEIPRTHKIEETGGPFYIDQKLNHTDSLVDDQALFIETYQGLVVLLGCGHSGVINTLEYIQSLSGGKPIRAVIGGMHLLNATSERLAFTGDNLENFSVHYLAPNHCTGLNAICDFNNRFPGVVHTSNVGSRHHFCIEF